SSARVPRSTGTRTRPCACRPGSRRLWPSVPSRHRGDDVDRIAGRERASLASRVAQLLAVGEDVHVLAKSAVLVAEPLAQRRIAVRDGVERAADRRRVDGGAPCAAGEAGEDTVDPYGHLRHGGRVYERAAIGSSRPPAGPG